MNKIQKKALDWLGLSYLVDAANWANRWRRPWEPMTVNTIAKEVNISDWAIILSDSRKLYCNLGPVKGAIDDKATYAVGRAWNAKFCGKDKEWGKKAEKWVNEMWYPVADARGGMFDFKTDLFLSSVCVDRDGDIFVLLTEGEDGWPLIQLLPAHLIGWRMSDKEPKVVEEGPYKGLHQNQGCVYNDQGRVVAYHVLGASPDEDRYYSARDLIQIYDPAWPDQLRGFPAFMHAILDLKTLRTVQGYEEIAAMLMSSIGLIEKNEMGAPDPNDPANFLQRQENMFGPNLGLPTVTSQTAAGVTTRFFRAGSGSGLEQLKNDRPGEAVSAFMDRLIRNACVGAGWPFELTWDASKLGGANVRLLIARAMRTVEDRQDLLRPVARRAVGYAVAKAIKMGLLEGNDEWYAWDFTLPARITADYGRDSKADLADIQAGVRSVTEDLAERGIDLDRHLETLAEERAKMASVGLVVGAPAQPVAEPDADEEDDTEEDDSTETEDSTTEK